VSWCIALPDGSYRVGLCFERPARPRSSARAADNAAEAANGDYYDILQLSPKADPDTIHRVFRILAQRFHPDNRETGNEEQFIRVLAAYEVLIDPEKRAAYDVRRATTHQEHFRIFEAFDATQGVGAEKRKRQGILAVLYARRVSQPEQPHLVIRELEELLNCPREHLEFSLWYLKENAWITRSDNGRYSITAKGVDRAERGVSYVKAGRLLPAAKPAS
jgi:curved DNA-binding protein CbpA